MPIDCEISKLTIMMAEDVWDLMITAYNYERRRSRKQFEEVCKRSSYQILEKRDNGRLLGFIGFWNFCKWIAIEHIAIEDPAIEADVIPELLNQLIQNVEKGSIIVAEVDIIDAEKTQGLKQCYKQAGFIENPYVYIQPSYHKGYASYPQRVMTYPCEIDYTSFKDLRGLLYRYVYGKKQSV